MEIVQFVLISICQLAPIRIGSFSTNVEFVVFECQQEGRKTMMYHQVKVIMLRVCFEMSV